MTVTTRAFTIEVKRGQMPGWRSALGLRQLTTLGDGSNSAAEGKKAFGAEYGNDIVGDGIYSSQGWGGGILAEDCGEWGTFICGMLGHNTSGGTHGAIYWAYDLATARWVPPLRGPSYFIATAQNPSPPEDAEVWWDPQNVGKLPDRPACGRQEYSVHLDTGELELQGDSVNGVAPWPVPVGQRLVHIAEYGGKPPAPILPARYDRSTDFDGAAYYIIAASGQRLKLSKTAGGPPIAFTDQGAGGYFFNIIDEPFREHFWVKGWCFRFWPLRYGEFRKYIPFAVGRYDNWAVIPASLGGEPAGTLVNLATEPTLYFNSGIPGNPWAHTFGLTSRTSNGRSANNISEPAVLNYPTGTACGTCTGCALSEKHQRIYTARTNRLAALDLKTNRFVKVAKLNEGYSPYAALSEGASIVTHGHSAHLMIQPGACSGGSGLVVFDLDEAEAKGILDAPVIGNTGAGQANAVWRPLLTPAVTWLGSSWTVAWSRTRQRLLIYQTNRDANGTIQDKPPASGTFYAVTIPADWYNAPWQVEPIAVTLAPGTTGILQQQAMNVYKRCAWSEALDCLLLMGSGAAGPVQAVRVW